ncbi:SRPBCC family protein [Micromonospora sp. SH-82]|uniref:SRPBCC family protein n=1 Tax=Micromonospora sp. SH-82 TaxID=3132938 RepID=UPI003EBAFF61
MIDVNHQIDSVQRQVGTRTLPAGKARVTTISQTYDASVEDVWDACTNPERIPRWLLPITGDLRLHGRYQLEGNAGGTVEECDPPKGFTATWEFGGETSWIEVRIGDDPAGGTRFELAHIAHVDDERWKEYGPGAAGVGWDSALLGLALHLASGAGMDPAEGAVWAGTEEGRRFMTLASERWYAVAVAAGADPEQARAAADRTAAFYTGTTPA